MVLVLLATVVGYQVMSGSATSVIPSSNQARRADRLEASGPPPPDVRLGALAPDEGGEGS